MPLNQYIVLKRAVDIESIASRRLKVYDTNRAYHDAKPLMEQLEKDMLTLLHGNENTKSNAVDWGKDNNWKSQLTKFQM